MTIDGENYRLTKHGRARYLRRVGQATDRKILEHAHQGDPNFHFVWKPDHVTGTGFRLITVLLAGG